MTEAPSAPESARRSAIAVGALFFVNGLTFSNWLPRIPEVRDRLGISNGGLGTALIGGGLGGLMGSLIVGRVLARWRSRSVLVAAASLLAALLPLIAFVPTALALTLVLTGLGFVDVLNDMSMNTQGMMIETRAGRSIINRLHGMWSLGFMLGALIGLGASAAKLDIRIHLVVIGVVILGTVYAVQGHLLEVDAPAESSDDGGRGRRAQVSVMVVAMAVMAIGVGWLEIIPGDWSAVLFRDVFDTGRWSGLGTVSFAAAMLAGRMSGDHVLERIGGRRMLTWAIALVVVGTVVVTTAPVAPVAVIGLVLWGLGTSVMFPQLYATAATLKGVSAGAGLGAMGVGQRLGFMLAPVCVGALADWQTLRIAIALLIALATVTIISTRRLVESPT